MTLAMVAIGGALGSVARFLVSTFVYRLVPPVFPAGTFVVNMAGCLLFGVIAGAAQQRFVLAPQTRAFLLIGVLGGFTTFSSFAFESFELLRDGEFAFAFANVAGQVLAGLVGVWAGFALTR